MLQRYRTRLSGPLLDRIDLHINVPRINHQELTTTAPVEASADIRTRVESARCTQQARLKSLGVHCNARMRPRQLQQFCQTDNPGRALLEMVTDRLGLSARTYTRILKVARTIADLAGEENIREQHLAEAIQYRSLDRKMG